jgi:hypothetical protein
MQSRLALTFNIYLLVVSPAYDESENFHQFLNEVSLALTRRNKKTGNSLLVNPSVIYATKIMFNVKKN